MKHAIKFGLTLAATLLASNTFAADMNRFMSKVEYSADQIIETGEHSVNGKVYVTPSKERREMNASGQNAIMIIRKDKKVGWTLMPTEKMYMEISFDKVLEQQPENPENYKIETQDMGSETINGIKTDKIKVTMTDKKRGEQMSGFWWVSKDGIVVKMDVAANGKGDKGRVKMTLSNLKIGKQNASLFEVPAGYQKFNMPNMQNLQDMMRAAKQAESANDSGDKGNKGGFNFNDAMKMMR